MTIRDIEEITHNWILSELNLIEGENMWQSQNQSDEI